MEKFSQLQEKEVINICDGKRLGYVCDLELDLATGKICGLIVPEEGSWWNLFCRNGYYYVPWRCIKRIGDDIILVDVDVSEISREG